MNAHACAEALGCVELGLVNAIVGGWAGAELEGRDAVVKVFEAVRAAVYDGNVDYVEYGAAVGNTVEAAVGGIEGGGTVDTVGIVALGSQSTEGNAVVAGDAADNFPAVSASWVLRARIRVLEVYLFHHCLGSHPSLFFPLSPLDLAHGWLTCIVCCFEFRGRSFCWLCFCAWNCCYLDMQRICYYVSTVHSHVLCTN